MSSEADGSPFSSEEIAGLFRALAGFPLLVLAVSGGADSTGLMVLIARWLEFRGADRSRVSVATVDHRLREGSAEEAAKVRALAARFGFAHTTLSWDGPKPQSRLQETAREARYALLREHAIGTGVRPVAVVTAHTEDDQAETLLMRLARGSGVEGLSAMRRVRTLDGADEVALVRPLIGVPKARLVALLAADGVTWSEDPSNSEPHFERVRLRAALAGAAGAATGLTNAALALSARRLRRANDALEAAAAAAFGSVVDTNGGAFAAIARGPLLALPPEIRLRVLGRTLRAFGGAARPARLANLEELEQQIARADKVAATVGGCLITGGQRVLRVMREAGRRGLEHAAIAPGGTLIWDHRFEVTAASAPRLEAAGLGHGLSLRAVGEDGYATLGAEVARRTGVPRRAMLTLPALWQGGRLVGLPAFKQPIGQGLEGLFEARWHDLCAAEFVGDRRGGTSTASLGS